MSKEAHSWKNDFLLTDSSYRKREKQQHPKERKMGEKKEVQIDKHEFWVFKPRLDLMT